MERRARIEAVRQVLDAAWRDPGFCVPNPTTYPHQWLWDSCFHSIVWSTLDDERAVVELANVLARQDPGNGFVPHMTYWTDPTQATSFWGTRGTSSITQPPLYGHAVGVLAKRGCAVPAALVDATGAGLRHLLEDRPRTAAGLIPIYHPWESGCDDSARWDGFAVPGQPWRETKGRIVADLVAAGGVSSGAPRVDAERSRPSFSVGSIGFNALVAWNAYEFLAAHPSASGRLDRRVVDELVAAIAERWDPTIRTWVDDGPPSGRARTLDAMVAVLVDPRPEAFDELIDPAAYGAPFGPRGAHRAEPSYQPDRYWRGPAWPQLTYLLWVAAVRAGRDDAAASLASALVNGADASGFAEYWHPETGEGLGAIPQSWAGLAIVADG